MKPEVFFITGGCGFIGSNFIQYILENTDVKRVVNLDKLTYAGNTSNLKEFDSESRYVFIKGDIIDSKLVRSIFQNHNPDCLVHFAAESHVDRSIDGPAEFINTNIIGTFTLLEESLRYHKSLSNNSNKIETLEEGMHHKKNTPNKNKNFKRNLGVFEKNWLFLSSKCVQIKLIGPSQLKNYRENIYPIIFR